MYPPSGCRQRRQVPLVQHIGIEVARALVWCHQAHVVHKDINPHNIVYNDATRAVQLIDFGLASELPR